MLSLRSAPSSSQNFPMAKSISFRSPTPTSSFMIASTRLTGLLNSSRIKNSSSIIRFTKKSQTKNFIASLLSLSLTSSSTQEQSPFLHTGRQAQAKHLRCRAFKTTLCRICSSVVSTTGKTTKETSPWLYLCMRFMEAKFTTCLTTTKSCEYWRTKIRRFRSKD